MVSLHIRVLNNVVYRCASAFRKYMYTCPIGLAIYMWACTVEQQYNKDTQEIQI